MNFDETLNKYWQLRARYEAGTLDADAFESAVQEMQVQDARGNLWQLGVQSGTWYRMENGTWVEDIPPEEAPRAARPNAQPDATQTGYQPQKRRKPWVVILAILFAVLAIGCCVSLFLLPQLANLLTPFSTNIDTNQSNDNPPSNLPADNPPPAPAIAQPTNAPVVPTIAPTEAPHSQEVSPEPTIYNFATCSSPCLSDLSNKQTGFPEGTTRLYLRFNYDWITPGSDYARVWKNGGQEWVRYQCKWDGPESGIFETDMREPIGFRSGEWTMEIYVNGQLITQNSFTVQGNFTKWEPAGTINRCK